MAITTLSSPFEEMHGKLSKTDKIISRRKKYRNVRGRVISVGKQEAYAVKNPRNYKKNPPKGAELANLNRWTETCRRASQILFVARLDKTPAEQQQELIRLEQAARRANHIPDYYTIDEARELLAGFRTRYQAQLPNTRGTHPDPQAPIDPLKGTGKRYAQFISFLRAILYAQLKSAE